MGDESQKIRTAINEAAKVICQADQTIAKAQQAIELNRELLTQHAEREQALRVGRTRG